MLLLVFSYIADLIFGDPEWFPHPVRGIGKLISFFEDKLRKNDNKWTNLVRNQRFSNGVKQQKGVLSKASARLNGVILAIIVIGISGSLAYLFIWILGRMHCLLGNLAWIYLGYTTLSVKDLRIKARKVLKEAEKDSLVEARKQLSKIVGRDTHGLNKNSIVSAAIESVAENTNDGIIAPLFYLILGGPVLAIVYKSINTLDSMVGYKNDKYLHFGWFSAKLDDAVNFIPALISGFLIAVSSSIVGKEFKESIKIMVRDGKKHFSPNSGMPEAAMAGALGIRLGGASAYQGKITDMPYLGKKKRALRPFFINEALTISLIASILMVFTGIVLLYVIP